MVKMSGEYLGEKRCKILHEPSKIEIATDAPKDNQGKGEAFSPTDLLAASLATCMITTMAIAAEKDLKSIKGASFSVVKEMASNPRKIARLTLHIEMPSGIPDHYRQKLIHIAENCPVALTLSKEVVTSVTWTWS